MVIPGTQRLDPRPPKSQPTVHWPTGVEAEGLRWDTYAVDDLAALDRPVFIHPDEFARACVLATLPDRRHLIPCRVDPRAVPVKLPIFKLSRVCFPDTIVLDNDFGSLFPIEVRARVTQAMMRRSSSAGCGVVEVEQGTAGWLAQRSTVVPNKTNIKWY